MGISAEQAAAVKSAADAVRGNAGQHAADFFIFFFKKFPDVQNKFPHFKGKSVDSLTGVPQFAGHTSAVLEDVLKTVCLAGDDAALAAKGKQVAADHVARHVGAAEYKLLFAALNEFLAAKLGGAYNAGAWDAASKAVMAALG